MSAFPKSDYEHYPRTLATDDFWGQVRRTVNGQPVGEDQIRLIVDAIVAGLDLQPDDVVLDLACGNGALSSYLFDRCRGLVGVDCSEYLISVAKQHFEAAPDRRFLHADAASYVAEEPRPDRFTKVLCYGSFSFFSPAHAEQVVADLAGRFSRVERVFLGNLPDREQAARFYGALDDRAAELDDHRAQIGIWRSRGQVAALARRTGWTPTFSTMPPTFYAHHYRFDALLERA